MEIVRKKQRHRSMLLICCMIFCYMLSSFIYIFSFTNKSKTIVGRERLKSFEDVIAPIPSESTENVLPPCTENLLDKRQNQFREKQRMDFENSLKLNSKFGSCRLLQYTVDSVVTCLDSLYCTDKLAAQHVPSNVLNRNNVLYHKELHFAFIGDSRIRQQFFNFLKIIPDYDQKSKPSPLPVGYHGDMEVTSDILRLRLSFQWRPLINDTVIDTVRQWATDSRSNRPYLIFIGCAVWHMLRSNGADLKLYQMQIKRLAPFLGQLANVSKVIWLNQYPVVEKFGTTGAMNTDIFSDKVHQYNEAVRSELQNYPDMRIIWDSSNSLVEEYIRGCVLFQQRMQFGASFFADPDHSYIDCNDFTHPGYSALSQATQLFLNDLCNEY